MRIYFTLLLSFAAGNLLAQGKFFGGNGDGFAVNQASMILPVKLVSFEAVIHENTAHISWTAIGENIAAFTLELSNDGSRFEWLAEKAVVSNAIAPVKYGYADGPRTGLWYYRLKWLEADGSAVYSKIIAVSFASSVRLKAFYNAGSGLLTVTRPGGESLIRLYGMDGKLYKTVRSYQAVCHIALRELPAGLYIVRVGNSVAGRFVKIE